MSSVDCEIYQVPLDETNEEENQEIIPQLSPVVKPRKKKVMTEAMKEKCRANLAKARAHRAELIKREKEMKEKIARECDVQTNDVEESEDDCEEQLMVKRKGKKIPGPKPKKKPAVPAPRRMRRNESSSEEDYSSDWSSDEDEPPKKPKKRASAKPRAAKKVSEKEKRIRLLEEKLDQIITHTKKQLEKPRTRTIKSTTTIINTPKPAAATADPALKAAAQRLLSMF